MEQQPSPAPPPTTATTTPSSPQPTDQPPPQQPPQPPQQQQQQQQQQPPQQQQQSTMSSTLLQPPPNANPNPNSIPKPQIQPPQSQSQPSAQLRPPFNRPWQPPQSSSPFFPSAVTSPTPAPPFSSSAPSAVPPAQRGGMAIGVPAHHGGPSPPPSSFSSLNPPSYGQPFGGLGRSPVSGPESSPSSSNPQMRQSMQGMQGMGMMGSLGASSSLRPSGVPAHLQQRPAQSSLRPQTSQSNQSSAAQNFQGHGLLRGPSVGSPSPASPSPNTPQGMQSHNQPWLSSGPQGKPPLAPPSFRPPTNTPSMQQRSHIAQQQQPQQQQQHTLSTSAPQQQTSSSSQPQQSSLSHQQSQQEHYALPPSRIPASLSNQQQITRGQGLGNQKPSSQTFGQPGTTQPTLFNRTAANAEAGEPCNRILSKRSIQEIVTQIDPSERLDPEVEDILVDIADEFVESITTFGCSLAKHRKSNTLEAKDILLHLERNWNMTLPGFSGDEIKVYKKPFTNDIHKERLAAIRKSVVVAETAATKIPAGQASGSGKGHTAKGPANIIGSPNP